MNLTKATPRLNRAESKKFIKKMLETEKKGVTEEDRKLVKEIRKCQEIVVCVEKKALEESVEVAMKSEGARSRRDSKATGRIGGKKGITKERY